MQKQKKASKKLEAMLFQKKKRKGERKNVKTYSSHRWQTQRWKEYAFQ